MLLIYQSSTPSSDTTSTYAGYTPLTYSLSTGVSSGSSGGGYINSQQKISRVDQNNLSSGPADGTNIHMGMFFLSSIPTNMPGGCRAMGVARAGAWSRLYLISNANSDGGWAWGKDALSSSQALGPGFYTATSSGTGNSASLVYCPLTGACSTYSTTGDGSTPSDWPVGTFACLNSQSGCAKYGDTYYKDGSLQTCYADETMEVSQPGFAICYNLRLGGYSIGYKLSSADITALKAAWTQFSASIGRS